MKTMLTWAGLVLAVLFCCSCAAGRPSTADVAADRSRWSAVRAVTADNAVDATERPVLDELLVAWDQKLSADEAASVAADAEMAKLIRVYGLAAVQEFFMPELQARAPELFRLLDQNGDSVLDEQELLGIDPASPVFAAVVMSTARRLLERHGH